ncbi:MAG TPA: ornithine cyclodeaminase family protein [Gemmatimonadales bacterium]|nr:ornithine cyclodeaminase family protein [Gemmatimonadales bacterium]
MTLSFLDEPRVRELLRLEELIPVVRRALQDLSAGRVVQPVRVVLPVAEHAGFLGIMPAYTPAALGAKLVTFYPANTGLATHHAIVALFRPETGEPLALMDGRLITELRTAAASAVATELLARADASVLAILGSGVQAASHLAAMRLVRPVREVRVWSPRSASRFAAEHGVLAAGSAEEAVRGADLIVTATSATTPVLRGDWVRPGAHVNAVGACRPEWRELDDGLLQRGRVWVDSLDAALQESGDVIAAGSSRVAGELGSVAAEALAGRSNDAEITIFKSVGVAVEDVAAAELVRSRLGGPG